MNTQCTTATTRRVCFTWLCALSPVLVLLTSIMATLSFMHRFGHWPSEVVGSFQQMQQKIAAADTTPFLVAMVFAWFAPIHLIVTLIHHRQLGFRISHVVWMALAFITGWVTYFVLLSNHVRVIDPFWMD